MAEVADGYEQDVSGVGGRAWRDFDNLVAQGESASPCGRWDANCAALWGIHYHGVRHHRRALCES